MLFVMFLLIQSICHAEYKVYIGQNDKGKLIAGIDSSLPITKDLRLNFNNRCDNLTKERPYWHESHWETRESEFPRPSTITFIAEIEYQGLTIGHSCTHECDSILETYNKKLYYNYIGYETKF